jgi:hypothetical protein
MRPFLWSSGQSFWLQIQRSGFDSRLYQIFGEVVGLKRGLLSLVSTTGELPERKSSGSGLENLKYGCRDPSRWPRGTLYPQQLALTSPTSGGRSVDVLRSRTLATECIFLASHYNAIVAQGIRWWRLTAKVRVLDISWRMDWHWGRFLQSTFDIPFLITVPPFCT